MLLGNNKTTKDIDNYLINDINIPSLVLMENAAISFVRNIDLSLNSYLIVCGKGNNGGDGFAIARQLYSLGKKVIVYVIDDNNMSKDCYINYEICKKIGIEVVKHNISQEKNINNNENSYDCSKLIEIILQSDCIIDSIFGTGLSSEVKGIYKNIIRTINKFYNKIPIYSVDIPSGISGDNGNILGIAVKANKTISFITYKKAFLNQNTKQYFGHIIIENIGINDNIVNDLISEYYLDKNIIKSWKIEKNPTSHKGDFGKITIFAGTDEFNGASSICTNACIRSGAGLTTLLTLATNTHSHLTQEAMLVKVNDNNINNDEIDTEYKSIVKSNITNNKLNLKMQNIIRENVLNSDVVAIGPGIGQSAQSLAILNEILDINKNNKNKTIKLVIDADGLNLIAQNKELLVKIKGRAILTPHIVEFSRLSGYSPNEIENNKFEITKTFAKKYDIILLLKGKNTIITDGINTYVNSTGNVKMANGGMGDSLTGIIVALVGQQYDLLKSACIGAYLHGFIGDKLSENQYVVNATHIIENIPKYISKIFI